MYDLRLPAMEKGSLTQIWQTLHFDHFGPEVPEVLKTPKARLTNMPGYLRSGHKYLYMLCMLPTIIIIIAYTNE